MKNQYYYLEGDGCEEPEIFGPFATQKAAEQSAAERPKELWLNSCGCLRSHDEPDRSFSAPIRILQLVRVLQPEFQATVKLTEIKNQ
jgi:hypothetical protein